VDELNELGVHVNNEGDHPVAWPVALHSDASFFFWGGAFTTGQAAQRAPPKTTGLPLAGPDHARSLRLSPSRSTACRRDPRRRRAQHPSCYLSQAPPPSPDPLACDLRLASVAVSAARRDSASSHPGRAYFSPPRRTCVCAHHTAAFQRCRMYVEHLHPDCRLAVFDEISIRHLAWWDHEEGGSATRSR
jgi:hypothetical protein